MTLFDQQKNGTPVQTQNRQPGYQKELNPAPIEELEHIKGNNRLAGKNALITGGDSGIGRAVAIQYAKEGANVAIVYLDEEEDAQYAKERLEKEGIDVLLYKGDITDEAFDQYVINDVIEQWGKLDILVNNAGYQLAQNDLTDITTEQFEKTFQTNIFSIFYLTKAAMPHLKEGSSIINTSSLSATGVPTLIDYSSTKGAINSFTRAVAKNVAPKGIRVNAVAPGPVWTPLQPASLPEEAIENFGTDTPLGRPGQPADLVGIYTLLASDEGAFITGQIMHVDGGLYSSS
ncbi:MAG: SDR family oxidoreductase [Bacillus sp. (in: firmicutes)]